MASSYGAWFGSIPLLPLQACQVSALFLFVAGCSQVIVGAAEPGGHSEGRTLISAGTQVTATDYSTNYASVVAFYSGTDRTNGKPEQGCAGVLIAQDAVLTAAHCLFEPHDNAIFMDGNVKQIIFGIDSMGSRYDIVDAVRVTSPDPHGKDLGIAFLSTCLVGEQVTHLPCCDKSIINEAVTLLGWGVTGNGQPAAETLMKGDVSFLPVCPDSEVQGDMTGEEIVCLIDGLTGSTGPTPGDSGGPYFSASREVLAIQSSGNALVAVALDLTYWRPWILSALKSMSRCQGYQIQAGRCYAAQAAACPSVSLDCTRSAYGGSQVPVTNCGSDGVVDTDTRATTTPQTTTTGSTSTTSTSTTSTTSTSTTPPLTIVTVRGRLSGSFTFYTSFSTKPCKDLGLEDLPHMDMMMLSTLVAVLETQFGVSARCVTVFGILIVNTLLDLGHFVSNDWTLFIANALAEFLDRDRDGLADPGQPIYYLRSGPLSNDDTQKGSWIPVLDSTHLSNADSVYQMLGGGKPIGYAQFTSDMTYNQSRDRVLEELIHTWHQFGLARAHPSLFGVTSVPSCGSPGACIEQYGGTDYYCHTNTGCDYTTSTLLRCMKTSSCIWYTKQLTCQATGSSCTMAACLTGGVCSDPACFGTAWLYHLMMAWSEIGSGHAPEDNVGTVNGGLAFPTNKSEVEMKLSNYGGYCEEFLEAIQDPWYNMLTEPLEYMYTIIPWGTATTTTTTTTLSRTTSTSTTATTTTTREWPKEPMNYIRKIKKWTVFGMAGGSIEFESVWHPKSCNSLEPWELPHLEEQEVVTVRNKIFQKYGMYSLCISVFGILVICNIEEVGLYKNAPWCVLEANIISELVDPNVDGEPDNLGIWENLRTQPGGHYLFLRSSTILNSVQDEMAAYIGTTVEVRQERDFSTSQMVEDSKRAMVEETVHVWQAANAKAFPDMFSVPNTGCPDAANLPNNSGYIRRLSANDRNLQAPDFPICPYGLNTASCDWQTSIMAKCAWWAMCNFFTVGLCCAQLGEWSSADFISGGHCSNPSCAGTEFYFHLLMSWTGTGSGYSYDVGEVLSGGRPFPADRSQTETLLRNRGGDCLTLLKAMQNRSYYAQPRTLTLMYTPLSLTRTTTTTTSTTTTSTSTTSTTVTTTTTTDTVTTTTSTTTKLPSNLVSYIKGSFDLKVDSPMTFIYDPKVKQSCRLAVAELASCPWAWVKIEMTKVYSRWRRRLNDSAVWFQQLNMSRGWRAPDSSSQTQRLLGSTSVKVAYGITVPPTASPYEIAGAMAAAPTANVTAVLKLHVISSIGSTAGLQIIGTSSPVMDVTNYTDIFNFDSMSSTTQKLESPSPSSKRPSSCTIIRSPGMWISVFVLLRSVSSLFDS